MNFSEAIKNSDVNLIENNLKNGIWNVNDTINFWCGGKPLHIAIIFDNLKVSKLLLKYGAEINAQNNKQQTSLHCAVRDNRKKTFQYLLKKGANVNVQSETLTTPLHFIFSDYKIEMLYPLLKHGANIYVRDIWKQTAFDHACYYHQYRLIEEFLNWDENIINTYHKSDLRIKQFIKWCLLKKNIWDLWLLE